MSILFKKSMIACITLITIVTMGNPVFSQNDNNFSEKYDQSNFSTVTIRLDKK